MMSLTKRQRTLSIAGVALVALVAAGLITGPLWLPGVRGLLSAADSDDETESSSAHSHAPGDQEVNTLTLSDQAQKNVGLELREVGLRDFEPTVTIPATVVGRPGRTEIDVSAPMTGMVTRVFPMRGEAVQPTVPAESGVSAQMGQPLFTLRLTHEDLVSAQQELLQKVEELVVLDAEIARLETLEAAEIIPGKRVRELVYQRDKTRAISKTLQKALSLHGLTQEQVERIVSQRVLVSEVTVHAPPLPDDANRTPQARLLQVATIDVRPGQQVVAGDRLSVLRDHAELHIEGMAFEEDAETLNGVAANRTPITALIRGAGNGTPQEVAGLTILYVEDEVDLDSRALRFYVPLQNEQVRNESTADGHRFIAWRYKPGQRVELLVPTTRWKQRIVLPVEAVVRDGTDRFVFRQDGSQFDRIAVYEEYRDQRWAVLGDTGDLFPGDVVASAGAYQMHLELKKKSSGGNGGHVGHQH